MPGRTSILAVYLCDPKSHSATALGLFIYIQVLISSLTFIASAVADTSPPISDGWRESFPIGMAELGEGDVYQVWVEGGWLHARRNTAEGDPDWHIVLARVVSDEAPKITHEVGSTYFAVSYRDGRYFVRDNISDLMSVREKKNDESGTLPQSRFISDSATAGGSCGSEKTGHVLTGWSMGDWWVLTGGPSKQNADVFVRLDSAKVSGGQGFSAHHNSTLRSSFHGETRMIDDGEFLHAERVLASQIEADNTRASLLGSPAPELVGAQWLNTDAELELGSLKGQVVLLDFWATWCAPCVKNLPRVSKLHETYQDRGFTVIGVHHEQGADTAAGFVELNHMPFPVLVDDGRSMRAYAVSGLPSYLLIGRDGNVVWGPSHRLPTPAELESELNK